MTHSLNVYETKSLISVSDCDSITTILISTNDGMNTAYIDLNKKDLRDFIGVLLHVQSKINK